MNDSQRPFALAVGGLIALAAAMGIGRFVYTPILPLMVDDLGLSQGRAGLIASANYTGYLAGALLAAARAMPGSRRAWLLGGLAASALTTMSMGWVTGFAALASLRFAGGIASAFVLVFASALVLDRMSLIGRPELSSLHFAGVGVGIVLSTLLIAHLVGDGSDWRGLWVGSGALALVAMLVVPLLVSDTLDLPATPAPVALGRGRALRAFVVSYGLFGFGYVITATFLVAIVRARPDAAALEFIAWLVVGATAMVSAAVWSRAGERIGMARAYALACAVEAIGVAASVLWRDTGGVLLAAALLGGTFIGISAIGLVAARRLSGDDPRRTLALMTAAFGLGQIIGPAFAGLVHDVTGTFVLPSLAAAAALLVGAWLVVNGGAAARGPRNRASAVASD